MIYLTGDTHGGIDIRKLLDKEFEKKVTSQDFLIICGDFGFIWNYKREKRKGGRNKKIYSNDNIV